MDEFTDFENLRNFAFTMAFVIFIIWLLKRRVRYTNYHDIYRQLMEINITVEKLQALDNILTDINVCTEENMKGVNINVPNSFSNNADYSMLIDGEDNRSELLRQLAYSEHEKQSALLYRQIVALHRIGTKQIISKTDIEVHMD